MQVNNNTVTLEHKYRTKLGAKGVTGFKHVINQHVRVDIRKNGLGLFFLNQKDFCVLEALENFTLNSAGLFTIASVSEYVGYDHVTVRQVLQKLCSYGLLFETNYRDGRARLAYGVNDDRVAQCLSHLEVIREHGYFGLRLLEQNVVAVIDRMQDKRDRTITSSDAPDLFARSSFIYEHAREDGRFMTSEKKLGSIKLLFKATDAGNDVWSAWVGFTSCIEEFQEQDARK